MLAACLAPICSPCGHVMQPVGPRTVWERQIGGEPSAFWPGTEYECVSCWTRTVLVEGQPFTPGSVGYVSLEAENDTRQRIPAKAFVGGERLPPDVRRDSHRLGGTRHLSQRQAAASIVDDFWSTDGADPLAALDRLASLLGVDMPEALGRRADSIIAGHCETCGTVLVDGRCSAPVCQEPLTDEAANVAPRDRRGLIVGGRFESFPALNEPIKEAVRS